MSSKQARERYLRDRTSTAWSFCHAYGFDMKVLNRGYQLRIEGVLDLYPVNGRWCWIPSGERGDWHDAKDIRDILLRMLPSDDRLATNSDGRIVAGNSEPQVFNVLGGEQPISGVDMIGVNTVTVHNLDLAPSDVPYKRIARNWLHKKWLQWRLKDPTIVSRKEIMGKTITLNVDTDKSLPRRLK